MPVLSARHKKPLFACLFVTLIFLIFLSSLHPSAPHHNFVSPYLHSQPTSTSPPFPHTAPALPSEPDDLPPPLSDAIPSKKTNPFSSIHIIHLPTHADRLASITSLSTSLSLPFLFSPPATPKSSSKIDHISNITSYRSSLISSLLASASPQDLYETPPFRPDSSRPEIIDLLFPPPSPLSSSSPPPPTSDDWPSSSNVSFTRLSSVPVRLLREMTELKPLPWKLTPGQLACWDSHAKTIKSWADDEGGREIVRKPLLILEDDVNAEEQVGEVFEELEKELPDDWDLVYLGFCASTSETKYDSLGQSSLGPWSIHPSSAPLCTHAYALSSAGAAKLSDLLRQELFAYSMSYDEALVFLIQSKLINGYTISPPLVVQLALGSDIQAGGRQDEMNHELLHPAVPPLTQVDLNLDD